MDTIETSLEANCDRWTGKQNDKATYRGSSYCSAQKYQILDIGLVIDKYSVSNNIVSTFILLICQPPRHLEILFFNSPFHEDFKTIIGALLMSTLEFYRVVKVLIQ